MTRRIRGLLAGLAVVFVLLASSTAAHAQEPPLLAGQLPVAGGVALVSVTTEVAVDALVESIASDGCTLVSLSLAQGGAFTTYIPGAPAIVNRAFPTELAASSILVVRCARPPSNLPDLHLLTLVTKDRGLPSDFVPDDLVQLPAEIVVPGVGAQYLTDETAEAFAAMLDAAREVDVMLYARSAYRSYAEQVSTHQHWVNQLGEEEAARRSAPPGHSEHQLGTVVDVTSPAAGWELLPELGEMPEGRWLTRNAWRFGFVESYPQGAEAITGYVYEPWHLRYIGRTHADWLRLSGMTLTEYLDSLDLDRQ